MATIGVSRTGGETCRVEGGEGTSRKESILRSFAPPVIERSFPEYPEEIRKLLE